MTELEKIAYTKKFIDKLANGINPLDDTVIPTEDLINNIRISRCFFYTSEILRKLIETGGFEKKKVKPKKRKFELPLERRNDFPYSDTPITLSDIANGINGLVNQDVYKRLPYSAIANWLVDAEILEVYLNADSKAKKKPTAIGLELGLSEVQRIGTKGEYTVVLYNNDAQHFILDHLDAVIEFYEKRKTARTENK